MDHVQDANDAAAKQNDEAVDESLDVLASYRLAGKASARAGQEQSSEHAPASTAAFFDVDNTIMRGASIYHFARGLARRKYFTFGQITGFAYKQLKFVTSGSEDLEDVASITAAALSFVEGRDVEELAALGEEIFDEITDRLIPGTLALAQQHLDSGHEVWLVTATPVELASILARRLGLTGALGTVSEIKDGNYTGRLVGKPLHGLAKAEAVRALAEREGLDLTQCWAYSDSANDIPMLSAVGHPVVVNADATLRAHARAQGWRVRDFTRREAIKKAALPTLAGAAGVVAGMAVGYVAGRSRQTPSI